MIESPATALEVVDRVHRHPEYPSSFKDRIDRFRAKYRAKLVRADMLNPGYLLGILAGLLFAQKLATAYGLERHECRMHSLSQVVR